MTTRRQLALELGGRHLLRQILRFHPQRARIWSPQPFILPKDVPSVDVIKKTQLDLMPADKFQNEEVPDFFTKPVNKLTDREKATIRSLFYNSVNMPPAVLRKWVKDPRFIDGVYPVGSFYRRAKLLALGIANLLTKGSRSSGSFNWGGAELEIARSAVFAIKNLRHPWFIDYENWATLRAFGHDWGRKSQTYNPRPLPIRVKLEAELRLLAKDKVRQVEPSWSTLP